MPAQGELYGVVEGKLQEVLGGEGIRVTTLRRLALLIVGLIGARSSVLNRMASGLWESGVSTAEQPSILRRLRRALSDRLVHVTTCYEPAVRTLVDWEALRRRGSRRSWRSTRAARMIGSTCCG